MAPRSQDAYGENRTDLIFVRLSPTEKARLEALAKGGTMSGFIRMLINEYWEISHRRVS